MRLVHYLIIVMTVLAMQSCSHTDYALTEIPNFNHLIGKNFSESIYKGRQVYKKIQETPTTEELETQRSDGCKFIFGVSKIDDVILYWRVLPHVESCKQRKKPFNV